MAGLPGVEKAAVNFVSAKAVVVYDESETGLKEFKTAVQKAGFGVAAGEEAAAGHAFLQYTLLALNVFMILSYWLRQNKFFTLPYLDQLFWQMRFLHMQAPFNLVLAGIVVTGIPIYREAIKSIRVKNINVETFMSLAILAAALIGEYLASLIVIFFMLVAELLESYTRAKARHAIDELVSLNPESASVVKDGEEVRLKAFELEKGFEVIIRPGDKIPADGVIVSGYGSLNESSITGEFLPVEKKEGDAVFAGTVNEGGAFHFRIEKAGAETMLARIIELVEEAEGAKAPIQRIADRFAAFFTPIVLSISALTYLVTREPLNAISVIIVACPCAVAIATPLAVVMSSGKAARKGIVVKGGKYLEELSRVDTMVMDKTGTLTVGEPVVTGIKTFCEHTEEEVLIAATEAEKYSGHALAKAILSEAKKRGIKTGSPESFEYLPGRGIKAMVNREQVLLGNQLLFEEAGILIPDEALQHLYSEESSARSVMFIGHNDELCGAISVADEVRETTLHSINELKELGIKRFIMLTGDNEKVAEKITFELGLDEYYAGLLPEDKVAKIRSLISDGAKVAMVGDGINDAPALALSSVGIAMGAAGSDAAIEAADVALMRDDWQQVVDAVKIGRATFSTIRQNLIISMVFNIVGVSLASAGIVTPVYAAILHVLPDIIVLLNSMRLLR